MDFTDKLTGAATFFLGTTVLIAAIQGFNKVLTLQVTSNKEGLFLKTFRKETTLPWNNITEIKMGYIPQVYQIVEQWFVVGISTKDKKEKVEIRMILKNPKELIQDIKLHNPHVIIDEKIAKKIL